MVQRDGLGTDETMEDKSLGDLVAQATGSVSDLVRAEMELAKLELKADAIKAAYGSVMFVVAGLAACLVVILLSISFAYTIVEWLGGGWHWLAFLLVALLYTLLAGALILFGYLRMKKIKGPRRTIATLRGDVELLRRKRSDKALDESDAAALTD